MDTKYFLLLAGLFSLSMLSCKEHKADLKAEEAAIMKTDSAWAASAGAMKDVDKIISYWADDAVVIPPGEPIVKGKDALRRFVEDSKKIPGFHISWKSSDPHFAPDGKMAYLYSENLTTMNDSSGNRISFAGRGYTVWRKEDNGEWKCVVDIWNSPP
ncbi:MAG TPA: DUF4440 domain-containing protein [Chitinophagaceae bacterium]|nr:DUF4440 domain-containing protein [Chitinophagaceae bacterium]